MKYKKVILKKDIYTNLKGPFPEFFPKGTIGKKIFVIDKEKKIQMIEIKHHNIFHLFAINEEDLEEINN